MKSVAICFYEAYPPASGAATVTYNCIRHMSGNRSLIQLGLRNSVDVSPDGVTITTLAGARSQFRKIAGLAQRVQRMVACCREIDPDVVILEGASWVAYHWLLLKCLRRGNLGSAIVYHSHNVEYLLRKEKHGSTVCGITRWVEGKLLRAADRVFAVSDVDARQFERLYGVRPDLLPNGVDVDRFNTVTESEISAVRAKYHLADQTVLFMGMYEYKPNRDAVDFLVRQVFPEVLRRRPSTKLVVLGGPIPYKQPWITNPGTIPHQELPAVVKACTVGVAPILSGSGTRLKILEYLAAGLPVISTEKGAEGLGVQPNVHICIAEDSTRFAEKIVAVLCEPVPWLRLACEGQKFVRERYSWPMLMAAFQKTIEPISSTPQILRIP